MSHFNGEPYCYEPLAERYAALRKPAASEGCTPLELWMIENCYAPTVSVTLEELRAMYPNAKVGT